MIVQAPETNTLKRDIQKLASFFDIIKKQVGGVYNFLKDNKNNSKIMLLLALGTSGLAIFFAFQLYSDISLLNGKTSQLNRLSSYDTKILADDVLTQPILKNSDTLKDLLQDNKMTE